MKIPVETLKACAADILLACGETPENAQAVAENMVRADARGITTHGTYLLSPIYKRVKVNQLSMPTKATLIKDDGATAVVDGGDGLGAIAGQLAVDTAIEKAKKYGIATVLVRNTNNVGSLAYYTEQAAKQGMIALMCCNAAPAMAPWGGADAFMGTNPIAMAIYTGHDLLYSADMASSVVARGKIRKASRNGQSIPADWAMDAEGNPTTDPNEALKGALLPMGGPKGSAIALTVDILSGILAGASHAPNLKSFHEPEGSTGVGAALIVLDIKRFLDIKEFEATMDEYTASIKGMKKAKGVTEILIPGELEHNKEINSIKNGVELDDNAIKAINDLLQQVGSSKKIGE